MREHAQYKFLSFNMPANGHEVLAMTACAVDWAEYTVIDSDYSRSACGAHPPSTEAIEEWFLECGKSI